MYDIMLQKQPDIIYLGENFIKYKKQIFVTESQQLNILKDDIYIHFTKFFYSKKTFQYINIVLLLKRCHLFGP